MFDYAVVGGGIGGVAVASVLSNIGKKVILFEKMDYFGGCAGTFERNGLFYNAGATTLVGLQERFPVRLLFDILNIPVETLPIKPIDPSIVVYIEDKIINRYKDRDTAFEEIQKNFPYSNNKILWKKIFEISDINWQNIYKLIPFNPSLSYFFKTGLKNPVFSIKTFIYNLLSAKDIIKSYLGEIDENYKHFLNSQILMTTQGYWHQVSFSSASMGLTYTNLDNYYVIGGMNQLLNIISKKIDTLSLKTLVKKVKKLKDGFQIETNKGVFYAKRVILNKTIWDFCDLLDEEDLKKLCHKHKAKYNKMWSSATIYFHVKDDKNILNRYHYQIIHKHKNPYTDSYSFFVSVSDCQDSILSADKLKSITISTHCNIDLWNNLSKQEYTEKKERLKEFIMKELYNFIPSFRYMEKTEIEVATPLTFQRYTGRFKGTVGGLPLIREYVPFRYPSNKTPVDGLFLIGDTLFPGQGWPGVVLGVFNLLIQLEREFYGTLHKHIT